MEKYQKVLALAAVVGATALTGCASRQPATVVVVPSQPAAVTAETTTIRSGTIIAMQSSGAAEGSNSQGASMSSGASGSAAGEQLVTVQFDDGLRQQFRLMPSGEQFKVGDRVNVKSTRDTILFTH